MPGAHVLQSERNIVSSLFRVQVRAAPCGAGAAASSVSKDDLGVSSFGAPQLKVSSWCSEQATFDMRKSLYQGATQRHLAGSGPPTLLHQRDRGPSTGSQHRNPAVYPRHYCPTSLGLSTTVVSQHVMLAKPSSSQASSELLACSTAKFSQNNY